MKCCKCGLKDLNDYAILDISIIKKEELYIPPKTSKLVMCISCYNSLVDSNWNRTFSQLGSDDDFINNKIRSNHGEGISC